MEQIELFTHDKKETKNKIKIVRLDQLHAKLKTDHLKEFSEMILSNEDMYPGIDKWLHNKVIPGMKSQERVSFVAYSDSKPIISAVVKKGAISKFCHLKIAEEYQDQNFGEMFFTLMSLELRDFAKEIFFTLPEHLWEQENKFFNSFGFSKASINDVQYRKFEEELRCVASFDQVWKTIPNRVVKLKNIFNAGEYSLDNKIVLSVKPKYAEAILKGIKKVEIRTRFDHNLLGSTIAIYSTSPQRAIVGQAKISYVVKDNPSIIWEKYSNHIHCTREEFDSYTNENKNVYAIILDEIRPFKQEVFLHQLSHLTKNELKPPMSYYKLEKNKNWSEAISIATILQNNFKTETVYI